MRIPSPARRAVAVCALLACTAAPALTACASGGAHGTVSVPGATPHSETPAHNKRLTVAETQRLLTLFTPPGSAHRTASRPQALDGPAMGEPATASVIDMTQYWRIPLSLHQAGAWVGAHPPRGLRQSGSSSGSGPEGDTNLGYSYTDNRSDPAWIQAELEIGITSAGANSSIWRIDGVALWMDPRPQRAPAVTKPLHVTAFGRCPSDGRHTDGVPPGPADSLLPPGTPDAALICSFTGQRLTAHRRLGAAATAHLAALVHKIGLAHVDGAVVNCPPGLDVHTVVAFAYPNRGPSAELWLEPSGCPWISNGTIMVGGDGWPGGSAVLHAVARLTR